MTDIADMLMRRARLMGHALAAVPGSELYGWGGHDWQEALYVRGYEQGGAWLDFRRQENWKGCIILDNVHPNDLVDRKFSDPIPTGSAMRIDAISQIVTNDYTLSEEERQLREAGSTDIGVIVKSYQADFSAHTLKTKEESFKAGFKQALKETISVGGEASFAKSETEISTEFSQELGKRDTEESGTQVSRTSGHTFKVQPETTVKVWATREVQPKKVIVTAAGDIEHGCWAGKRGRKNSRDHWEKKGGEYTRHQHWDSFASFLRVIRGEGNRDEALWDWFHQHPAPAWLVAELQKPLNNPFVLEVPYDAVTDEQLHYEKLK